MAAARLQRQHPCPALRLPAPLWPSPLPAASWTPRPSHPQLFSGQSFLSLWWLHILRSMLSALLLLLAVLSLRTDHSACSSSSFSTTLMSLFALRSRDSCRGTWEDCGKRWEGHQPSSRDFGCWEVGLGCYWGCRGVGRAPGTGCVGQEGRDGQRAFSAWSPAVAQGRGVSFGQLPVALLRFCPISAMHGAPSPAAGLLLRGGPPPRSLSSIPTAKLHVATEAPAKACASHRRFPPAPAGLRSGGPCVGRGCGSRAASSPSPGSWSHRQQRGLCGSYVWFTASLVKSGLSEHILRALL